MEELKHGLALCCNSSPEFKLGIGCSSFYECPKCKRGHEKGGWSTDKPWIASLWNKSMQLATHTGGHTTYQPAPKLDAGDNWRYAELTFTSHLPYGEAQTIYRSPFILFSSEQKPETESSILDNYEAILDEFGTFRQFTLRAFDGQEASFNLPTFKNHMAFSIHLGKSFSSNGNWWYHLNITGYNQKWISYFTKHLKLVIP